MHKIQKRILKLADNQQIGQLGYRKLGELIKVGHPQQVKWHLQKLISDGYLRRLRSGDLKVISDSSDRFAKVPILGMANCGQPLSYADGNNFGYLTLSANLIQSKELSTLFAVQATGDSMDRSQINGSSIEDGDYVLVDSSQTSPQHGDYVVSSIDGLANIKRYVRDDDNQLIGLISESNSPRPPIIVDPNSSNAFLVHGKVVQVINKPKV